MFLVLKRVHPIPARDLEKASIVSIRSPFNRENREKEQQSQWLLLESSTLLSLFRVTKTSLNSPFERETKERRWDKEEVESEGKVRGTASCGKINDEDKEIDECHEGDDDDEDDGDGYEKMM